MPKGYWLATYKKIENKDTILETMQQKQLRR